MNLKKVSEEKRMGTYKKGQAGPGLTEFCDFCHFFAQSSQERPKAVSSPLNSTSAISCVVHNTAELPDARDTF